MSPTLLVGRAPRFPRWLRRIWQRFDRVLVLLLAAAFASFTLRYCVPLPAIAAGTPLAPLATFGAEKPMALWLALFLIFGAVLQYWKARWLVADPHAGAPTTDREREFTSLIGLVGSAVLAAWFLRGSLFELYRVEGSSMLPALEASDRIVVSKLAFGLKPPWQPGAPTLPQRGHIVVFSAGQVRGTGLETLQLVKRVIGVPGDRVRMRGSQPIINDWEVPSCFVGPYPYINGTDEEFGQLRLEYLGDTPHLALYSSATPAFSSEYTVQAHEVFVLGDNRANSDDSRSFDGGHGGGVPQALIKGRATRFLTGTRRKSGGLGNGPGSASFAELGREIDASNLNGDFNLEGMDLSGLRARLSSCLEHPPDHTSPP